MKVIVLQSLVFSLMLPPRPHPHPHFPANRDLKAQLEQQLASSSQDRAALRSAQAALQAEQTQQAALRLELGRARDQAQADVRALREAHADELQAVEDKVKGALGRRDELIASLRESLARTVRAKDEAEHVLSDLKSTLSLR